MVAQNKKKKKKKETPTVYIRRKITNYEFRFGFNKQLVTYIKTLPREHRKFKVDNIMDVNGGYKDDFIWIIRDIQMGAMISFLVDNSIPFIFENLLPEELTYLRGEYKIRMKRVADALKFKQNLDIKGMDFSFMKLPPYDYQKQAVRFFEINNGCSILGDEPGVGKSLAALSYAVKNRLKTLIICPASIKLNWRKEITKFSEEKAHLFKYEPSKKSGKTNTPKSDSLFHVINYESIQSYIKLEYVHKCKGKILKPGGSQDCGLEITDLIKKYKKCPNCKTSNSFKTKVGGLFFIEDKMGNNLNPDDYDLVVIDEFHRIKDDKTDWTKIITLAFSSVSRKLLVSGTAIKSRPMEIFTGLNFIDPKTWNSKHEFGLRYCAGFETNFGWDYTGASNLEELFGRISPFFIRRLKSEVLEQLPPKTYTEIEIELTPSERKEYNRIVKEMNKVTLEDGSEEEREQSYLEKIHKLKQFTGSIKLERVISDGIVDDIVSNGDKVVFMSDYQSIAETLKENYEDICVLHTGNLNMDAKEESVTKFQNDKKTKVFSGMIGASGVGITLTEASRLIFLGFAWTSGDMMQAEDRIHRATTTHDNIHIITYICIDTIDEEINRLLKKKAQVVSKVLDNKNYVDTSTRGGESIIKALINGLT